MSDTIQSIPSRNRPELWRNPEKTIATQHQSRHVKEKRNTFSNPRVGQSHANLPWISDYQKFVSESDYQKGRRRRKAEKTEKKNSDSCKNKHQKFKKVAEASWKRCVRNWKEKV